MPPTRSTGRKASGSREAPSWLVILLIVLIIGIVGAGGFYAYNGGWATAGQLDNKFQHEIGPIMAAKRGNTEAFDKENELRKQRGQQLLQMPKDRQEAGPARRERAEAARRALEAKGGPPTTN